MCQQKKRTAWLSHQLIHNYPIWRLVSFESRPILLFVPPVAKKTPTIDSLSKNMIQINPHQNINYYQLSSNIINIIHKMIHMSSTIIVWYLTFAVFFLSHHQCQLCQLLGFPTPWRVAATKCQGSQGVIWPEVGTHVPNLWKLRL